MSRRFKWPHENYYWDITQSDVVKWLNPLTKVGWRWRYGDSKITNVASYAPIVPWHYISTLGEPCWFSNHIIFDVVQPQVGERWVPVNCQACWKTVIYPKTLDQLFALEDLMLNDPRVKNHARKCGADLRKYTPHLYGGYSYGKSLEHGREIFAAFRAAVDEHPGLGPDVKMILKRGCTEMEAACGPSDKWKVDPKHARIEEMCAAALSFEPNEADTSDHHLRHIHRIWIEHACMSGDETYLHYTGGQPIHGKYVTYHEKAPAQKKRKKEKR